MEINSYDLIIIGAGPAGEVGAIRAAQLGLSVAIVEQYEHLGGTCLNFGCIPTKALIESAKMWSQVQQLSHWGLAAENLSFSWEKILARKNEVVNQQRNGLTFLMKKNKVTRVVGRARLGEKNLVVVAAAGGETFKLRAKKAVLLATGSAVRELPGAHADGQHIFTSDSILSIDHVPSSMVIIGGGVVGMEFASLFGRFGSMVTVLEMQKQILPSEDVEVVSELTRLLKKQNVTVITAATFTGCKLSKKGLQVTYKTSQAETSSELSAEIVLTSIGRLAQVKDMGLEALGLAMDGPFVRVDSHYQSSVPGIFAVGDIINTPALAHTASAEAKHAVEIIAGRSLTPLDYSSNPSGIYTYPEVASLGMTEALLVKEGIAFEKVTFPFAPLAKAKIENARDGFIKILYGTKYREILGVHIIGARATELISEFVLGKMLEATVDEFGHAIHPHPTIAETIMEAAHMADGGGIHL